MGFLLFINGKRIILNIFRPMFLLLSLEPLLPYNSLVYNSVCLMFMYYIICSIPISSFSRKRLQKILSSWCSSLTGTPNTTIWNRCLQLIRFEEKICRWSAWWNLSTWEGDPTRMTKSKVWTAFQQFPTSLNLLPGLIDMLTDAKLASPLHQVTIVDPGREESQTECFRRWLVISMPGPVHILMCSRRDAMTSVSHRWAPWRKTCNLDFYWLWATFIIHSWDIAKTNSFRFLGERILEWPQLMNFHVSFGDIWLKLDLVVECFLL